MNPWHDVDLGDQVPEIVPVLIEVPKGSKTKYELDKASGLIRADRVLFSSMHYPANYGFIPRTYGEDHDPLDVLLLGQEAFVPLCIAMARPLGVIEMIDQGEADDKIIAVHVHDPEYSHYRKMEDLPPHRLMEIKRFFLDYKALENKTVEVKEFLGAEFAKKLILKSQQSYQKVRSRLIKK